MAQSEPEVGTRLDRLTQRTGVEQCVNPLPVSKITPTHVIEVHVIDPVQPIETAPIFSPAGGSHLGDVDGERGVQGGNPTTRGGVGKDRMQRISGILGIFLVQAE